MTGLECLQEEMKKRGATKSTIDSKAVPMLIEIFADNMGLVTDSFFSIQEEMKKSTCEMNMVRNEFYNKSIELSERETALNKTYGKLHDELFEMQKRLCDLQEQLEACETEESRDRIRLLDQFDRRVLPMYGNQKMNGYERTAYIKGCAAILSGVQKEQDGGDQNAKAP